MENGRIGLKQYQRVAQTIAGQIESGVYIQGDRLPGVRQISRQMGVSVSTVVAAHQLLEDQGYLDAVPKSGFYVRKTPHDQPLPTVSRAVKKPMVVSEDLFLMRFLRDGMRPGIMNLGTATPHKDYLPVASLQKHFARSIQSASIYHFPPGYEPLRRQIAKRMLNAGCTVRPEQIVVTNGAQEALWLCLRLMTGKGDVIALESPVYYGLLNIIESLNLKAIEIPSDPQQGISLNALRSAIDQWPVKVCLVAPQCNNPLGFTMPDNNKRELLTILRNRQIPLIEDDVYGELSFSSRRAPAIKAFDDRDQVSYCSSFSKTIAPGMRIGWVIAPRIQSQIEHHKFMMNIAVPGPNQVAMANYLGRGGHERFMKKIRHQYAAQIRLFSGAISEHFPTTTKISRPSGGFVLWLELPESVNVFELYDKAIEHNICFAPGPLFSSEDKFKNCLRINCAVPWSSKVMKSIVVLGQIVKSAG